MSQPAEKRMGVSDARANMTDVIAEVRLLGTPVVLTRRDKPQAVLVSVEDYESARRYRAIVEFIQQRVVTLHNNGTPHEKSTARVLGEALEAAGRDINAARNISES